MVKPTIMLSSAINSTCCIFLLLQNDTSLHVDKKRNVDVAVGTIQGSKAFDGDYYMYLGIPYAKINESNHFGHAIPYTIDYVFEAHNDSAICPQLNKDNNTIIGTIDCLRLNVYVPTFKKSSDTLLPVMVWIHGGYFHHGFAGRNKYGPSYIVQHNVILVTFNYRTGPYGFMCLDIPEVPGNQGLKDQHLAIKWIKENIEVFGGNPDKITLFGQGAGGHSIDLHLMSNREILFNQIILQSGSAQALTVLYKPDKLAPLKLARYGGFETDDLRKAILYLSKLNSNLVISAATKLNIQFKPCVEALFDNVEAFIEDNWIHNKAPKVKNVSLLMGFNKLEKAGLSTKDASYFNLSIINDSLSQVFHSEKINESKDLVSHFYFGDEEINNDVKWSAIQFASDFTYIHPVHRTLKKYLESEAGPIYFYMFSYVGERNEIVTTTYDEYDSTGNLCCASHGDELGYLFNMQNKPELSSADEIIMQRMTTMWTNFAKYSNPTPVTSELLPVLWEPVTKGIYYYMTIDTELKLEKRPLHERMAFWDLFYYHSRQCQKSHEE